MERRKFTREFKVEAVKLIKERGVGYVQAARDLGVHQSVLRDWVEGSLRDRRQLVQSPAQPPLLRSDAIAGGYPDDKSHHRYRGATGHRRARSHHRRQERPCEQEGVEADLMVLALS